MKMSGFPKRWGSFLKPSGSLAAGITGMTLVGTLFLSSCTAQQNPRDVSEGEDTVGQKAEEVVDPNYIPPVAIDFDFYDWSFEPILTPDGKTLIVFHVEEKEINIEGQFRRVPVATSVTLADLDASLRQTTVEVPGGGALSGVHVTEDGNTAFLPGTNPYQAHVLDLDNHAFTDTINVLSGTVFSPDGLWMLGYERVGAPDGSTIFAPVLQSVTDSSPPQDFGDINSSSFGFSSDSDRFFLAGEKTATGETGLYLGDVGMKKEPLWIPTRSGSTQTVGGLEILAFSPSGNVVLVYHNQAGGTHTFSLINTNISTVEPVYEFRLVEGAESFSQEEIATFNALGNFVTSSFFFSNASAALFSRDERFFFTAESGREVLSAESGEMLGVNDPDYMSTAGIRGKPIYFPHLQETFNVDFPGGEIRKINWEALSMGAPMTFQAQQAHVLASLVVQEERFIVLLLDTVDEYGSPLPGAPNTVRVVTVDLPQELTSTY